MDQEETLCKKVYEYQRINVKKELYLMAQEENGMKKYYESIDLYAREDSAVSTAVDTALKAGYSVTLTKAYLNSIREKQVKGSDAYFKSKKALHDAYKVRTSRLGLLYSHNPRSLTHSLTHSPMLTHSL